MVAFCFLLGLLIGFAKKHQMKKLIEMQTVSETNMREHWAERHKRRSAQRGLVAWSFKLSSEKPPPLPVVVTLTRISPRMLDVGDNLNSSMKAVRDEVAKQLGIDDADPRVTWFYEQRKGDPKKQAVEIEIVEDVA